VSDNSDLDWQIEFWCLDHWLNAFAAVVLARFFALRALDTLLHFLEWFKRAEFQVTHKCKSLLSFTVIGPSAVDVKAAVALRLLLIDLGPLSAAKRVKELFLGVGGVGLGGGI